MPVEMHARAVATQLRHPVYPKKLLSTQQKANERAIEAINSASILKLVKKGYTKTEAERILFGDEDDWTPSDDEKYQRRQQNSYCPQ